MSETIETLNNQLVAIENDKIALKMSVDSNNLKISSLNDAAAAYATEKKSLIKSIKELKMKFSDTENKLHLMMEEKEKIIQASRTRITTLNSSIKDCKSEIEHKENHISDIRQANVLLSKKYEHLNKRIGAILADKEQLNMGMDANSFKMTSLRASVFTFTSEKTFLSKLIEDLGHKLTVTENEKAHLYAKIKRNAIAY